MIITRILEKLFHLEPKACETCEVLKVQLELANSREQRLLNELMKENASYPPELDTNEIEPIRPRIVPWKVRQAELEKQDRLKLKTLQEHDKELEELRGKNEKLENELLDGVEFTPASRDAG